MDYAGNFIYENTKLSFILTDEGRLVPDSSGFEYEYFIKDHLGNTRLTVKDSSGTATVMSEAHYYPFGLEINTLAFASPQQNVANKYLYNGKELQDDFALGWYDYGARFYDPIVPHFLTIDPLAEKYYPLSPYNYVANNPIMFIDPNGMYLDDYGVDKDGNVELIRETDDGYDVLYAAKSDKDGNTVRDENGKMVADKTKGSVTVNNKSILPSLSNKDGEGRSISKGNTSGSIDDVFEVFYFVANNTDVEWGAVRYEEKGTNKYAIFTDHEADAVSDPTTHGINNVIAMVHNHTYLGTDVRIELKKMGQYKNIFTNRWQVFRDSDVGNIVSGDKSFVLYTYYPTSKRLYHASKKGAKEIKKINGYKDFYFGVLNHR